MLLNQKSGHLLGVLQPQQEMALTLDLVAVAPGMQTVQGLMVFDRVAGKSHDLAPLPQLYIEEEHAG